MKTFIDDINSKAKKFNEWLKSINYFRIYTHLDADGLSSASIIIKTLKRIGKGFHLSVIEQLNEDLIKKLSSETPLILLDFGSGQLSKLSEAISKRRVLILDHHQPQGDIQSDNLIHVNPCLTGIDGGSMVSASGVTYLFCKQLGADNFCASLAIIGASGDLQDLNSSINSSIIKESNLTSRKDLNIYGLNMRPLHKALEYTDENFIPGISGDETSAVNFINELKIPLKKGDDWRTISDLTSKEKQDLISGIIIKRSGLSNAEDIFQTVHELEIGSKRSVDEWSAVLNACGRMNLPSLGVNSLLNPSYEDKVSVILKEYRNSIAEGLRFIDENKNLIKETDKTLYFLAGSKINYKIIGTLCSIKSTNSTKNFIVGLAEKDDLVKISVRRVSDEGIKASDAVIKAVEGLGEGGGHAQAAGASLKKGSESAFIEAFEKALKQPF